MDDVSRFCAKYERLRPMLLRMGCTMPPYDEMMADKRRYSQAEIDKCFLSADEAAAVPETDVISLDCWPAGDTEGKDYFVKERRFK